MKYLSIVFILKILSVETKSPFIPAYKGRLMELNNL